MVNEELENARAKIYQDHEWSPLLFIHDVWGLLPQPLKPEYKPLFEVGLRVKGKDWDKFCTTVTGDWFQKFDEGKHITWQQALVLYGIEKALLKHIPMRVSIVSGHGIGKTALLSWIILWFLWVHPDCQVACTSPSKEQMYDVLWKELKKWIDRMQQGWIKSVYEWETQHVRMKPAPAIWFARAKTSSKENTEALAGVHADWVLMAVDEASGVEEPIFETMEGALTSGNILVFLISNGTRNIGYFYDTHHKDTHRWQNYGFNAEKSPRVSGQSIAEWKEKYGEDSVQYAVRVLGKFPDEGVMDDRGYVQLFNESEIRFRPYDPEWRPVGRTIGALDASGEGQDTSEWAARDRFLASVLHTELVSNDKSMAAKSITLCDQYHIDPIDFLIDAFGKGMNVAQEIALMTSQQKRPWRVTPVNVGDQCEDPSEREFYTNKRAQMYYKFMLWCRAGGEFMELPTPEATKRLKDELLTIRFKRTMSGRIQLMSKVEMKKLGFNSPNKADAIAMTFLRPDGAKRSLWGDPVSVTGEVKSTFDPFDPLGLSTV